MSGNVEIRGKAIGEGNETISVEVKIDDGVWQSAVLDNATEYGLTWHYKWNTTNTENGQHKIYARAYDGEKHSQCYIIVEVDNGFATQNGKPLSLDVSLLIMAVVIGFAFSKMNKK